MLLHYSRNALAASEVVNAERFGMVPLKRSQLDALFEILRDLRAAEDGFEV